MPLRPSRPKKLVVVHRVTSAPMSLAEDTDMRIRRYLITMAVRTACFILAVVVDGWLRWLFVLGAVLLPYVAVVLANAVGPRWGSRITGVDKYAETGLAAGSHPGTIHHPQHP